MIELLKALFLGVVQGVTELLPISSSSHIIFFDRLLSFSAVDEKLFSSVIQMGSALAIILRLFPDIKLLGKGFVQKDPSARSMILSILLAFLPAAMLGVLFHSFIKATFYTTQSVAYALLAGGALLVILDPISAIMTKDKVTWKEGLGVGLVQTLALIPGFSRLGSTIIGGVLSGLSRATLLKFSFLVAIPVLIGAGSLDLIKASSSLEPGNFIFIGLGAFSAFCVTYYLFPRVLEWLTKTGFLYVGWYRICFGALLLI